MRSSNCARQQKISAAATIRAALRGDLHVHSNWSDGSAPIEEMMLAARELGHEYCALTDHSPRLTVANGLSPERLRKQLDVIDELRETVAPMRILTGIEVDILDDGSLDQEPELLERLDVVVASVHSKLSMDAPAMTRRMVNAVSNPHADVLGHCTGRLVTGGRGVRPESKFDAEKVFTACRDNGTAVEINSRPERRDPPTRLLNLALEIGCLFSIDTDSHAPGQLEFLGYGAQRALDDERAGGPDRQHLAGRAAAGVERPEAVDRFHGSHSSSPAGAASPGRVAADEHAAGDGGVAVAAAHLVDGVVDRRRCRRVSSNGSSNCWAPSRSMLDTAKPTSVSPRSAISGAAAATSSRAASRITSVDAVARGMVCERVARPKSSNRNRSTTVRPVRSGLAHPPGDPVDQVDHDGVDLSCATSCCLRRPSARCAPTERRRTPVTTRRRSMLRDNANSWRPIAPPTIDAERGLAEFGDIGDRLDAVRVQLLRGLDADAPQPAHRQRVQERQLPVGRYQQQPVGLGLLAGDLGQELGAGDADGDRQADAVADLGAQPRGDLDRRARHPAQPDDVEEGLVDRQRFDHGRGVVEHLEHRVAGLASTPTSAAARRSRAGTAARAWRPPIAVRTP